MEPIWILDDKIISAVHSGTTFAKLTPFFRYEGSNYLFGPFNIEFYGKGLSPLGLHNSVKKVDLKNMLIIITEINKLSYFWPKKNLGVNVAFLPLNFDWKKGGWNELFKLKKIPPIWHP